MVIHHLVVRACTAATIDHQDRDHIVEKGPSIVPVGSGAVTPVPKVQGLVSEMRDVEADGSPTIQVHATQQNLYEQRSMNVQVGIDSGQVIQHVHSVEAQAHSMVHEAVARIHETQQVASVVHEAQLKAQGVVHETQLQAQRVYDEAQSALHQARSRAATVEDRASVLIQEMNARHQAELTKAQDVANQLHHQAQVRSQEADAQIQKLMAVVESQSQALDTQRGRNEELSAQIAALQNEVVLLRHSSVPVAPPQDRNGAVNQEELMIVIDSLRREIRQIQTPGFPIQLPVPQRMSIATPPHDAQSACAGSTSEPGSTKSGQRSSFGSYFDSYATVCPAARTQPFRFQFILEWRPWTRGVSAELAQWIA